MLAYETLDYSRGIYYLIIIQCGPIPRINGEYFYLRCWF